nr:MAG TPA: hypothetical protein [Caudoviricetes sp.]
MFPSKNDIKFFYDLGIYTKSDLDFYVDLGYINDMEYRDILGIDNELPEIKNNEETTEK